MKRILWLCTHRTQWREELPLLLDAGFEVVPARHGHPQAAPQGERPEDPYYLQTWRDSCTLAPDLIERLRDVSWFERVPADVVPLACEAFDGIFVTSFAATLLSVARWFPGHIFFRVFGHGGLVNYSAFLGPRGLDELQKATAYREGRYHWCPILPTLSYVEEQPLLRGEVLLEPFVSAERVPYRWDPDRARPYTALVLSKAGEVLYYTMLYKQLTGAFRRDPGSPLALRILGQNKPAGGTLGDPEILGTMDDEPYFQAIARSSAFFYQGDSLCHLHWSVLEALAMGVPVVMLQSGYLAWALRGVNGPGVAARAQGIVEGLEEARDLLAACHKDATVGQAIVERQAPLARKLTDRAAAVTEYRRALAPLAA